MTVDNTTSDPVSIPFPEGIPGKGGRAGREAREGRAPIYRKSQPPQDQSPRAIEHGRPPGCRRLLGPFVRFLPN